MSLLLPVAGLIHQRYSSKVCQHDEWHMYNILGCTGGQDSIRAALVEVDPLATSSLSINGLVDLFKITAAPQLSRHQVISIHRHLTKESPSGAVTPTALLHLFE